MESNDLFETFTAIMKSRFTKLKKYLIYSIFIGAGIGLLVGIGSYMTNMNSDYENIEPSFTDVVTPVIGYLIGFPIFLLILFLIVSVFWFPSDIAKKRGHAYTSLIQILNLGGVFMGVTWFIAAAWAIYPSEKSLIDPIAGNPTGLGRRNAGDTVGAAVKGSFRGWKAESKTDQEIDNLIDMRAKGLINDEEFQRKKREILNREN